MLLIMKRKQVGVLEELIKSFFEGNHQDESNSERALVFTNIEIREGVEPRYTYIVMKIATKKT